MGRQLVELGYRGLGDAMKREEFEARKLMLHERSNQKTAVPKQLASLDKDLTSYPFLQNLERWLDTKQLEKGQNAIERVSLLKSKCLCS